MTRNIITNKILIKKNDEHSENSHKITLNESFIFATQCIHRITPQDR